MNRWSCDEPEDIDSENPKKPYILKVVRNSDPEENELGEEIEARLDKLSELYKEAEAAF